MRLPLQQHLPVLLVALAAVVLRLVFHFHVDRSWEDALITVLHAENFWDGLGLTHFHQGQPPVHGFTSPLSVLIPLAGDVFSRGQGLVFLKLVSAFAGGATALYAYAICRHPRMNLPLPLALLAAGYCAIEYQQILWGMAGLETQVVVLIVLASMYQLLAHEEGRDWPLGVLLGLCMLARPDLLFWCVIAGLVVLARSPRSFVRVTGWALLVYVPWLVFATLYYGSFVPNTIGAKEAAFGGYPLPTSWADLWRTMRLLIVFAPLGPVFAGYGTGFQPFLDQPVLTWIVLALAVAGIAVGLRRRGAVLAMGLFVLAYTAYYLYFVPIIFGWYLPPINAVTVILAALGLAALTARIARTPRMAVLGAVAAGYLALLAWPLPLFYRTERAIQANIEDGVRKDMGLYLRQAMSEHDTVSLEPLGYVAYYSRRDVYDTPGLANPRVVAFYKSQPRQERTLYNLVRHFQPTFVVLRPGNISMEYGYFLLKEWFRTFYESDRQFQAEPRQLQAMWRSEATYDREFVVFKRRELAGAVEAAQWNGAATRAAQPQAPAIPRAPAYVAAWERGTPSVAVTLPAERAKLVFHARCARCPQPVKLGASLARGGEAAERSVAIGTGWQLVSLDSADLAGTGGPAILRLSAPEGAALEATQPFLLKVNERVPALAEPPMRVEAVLRLEDFQVDGQWGRNGVFDATLSPPNDHMQGWIGSHVRADADAGRVVSRPIRVGAPGLHLLTYALWGPNVGNLSLGLDTDGDGKIDVPIPGGTRMWRIDFDLTPYAGREVRLVAVDDGRGWGEWFGFAEPVLYRVR